MLPSARQRVPCGATAGMVWVQNAQSMLQHQALPPLPVMLVLHSVFLVPWRTHHHAHANPIISQVLQRGEMWLLLVALCLSQGLGNAVPHARVSHDNPEQFMNIVSARGSNLPLVGPGLPQVVCPKFSPGDQLGSTCPLPWHLHLGSARGLGVTRVSYFCMGVTHFMPSAWRQGGWPLPGLLLT